MIEVFKTNVRTGEQARWVLGQLHEQFPDCEANFDLEDCDRILRVKCAFSLPDTAALSRLVRKLGFRAEVLEDDGPFVVPGRQLKKTVLFQH